MLTQERAGSSAARGGRRRGPIRARRERLQSTHSYVTVLLLIVAQFLVAAGAPESAWSRLVLLLLGCATLVAALWASGLALWKGGLTEAGRPPLVLIALAVTALAVLQIAHGGNGLTGVAWLANTLLIVASVSALSVGVFDQDKANAQSVVGAICIYLLLGLLFTALYSAVAVIGGGPFFVQAAGDGTASERLYFSYVTLTTVGYGDLTPAGDFGHTLAVSEALLGQLYLVTVIAVLVSRVGRESGR